MPAIQTTTSPHLSIKWCDLENGQTRVEIEPDLLTHVGFRDTAEQLRQALDDYERWPMLNRTSKGDFLSFHPGKSPNVSVEKVDYLPEKSSNCRSSCPTTPHIIFYPEITEDSDGKRTYSAKACCNPALSDPRNAGYRGFIPELLHFRGSIDAKIIDRLGQVLDGSTASLSLEEDQAGFIMMVDNVITGHDSDKREFGEVAECAGYVPEDPSLSNNAIKAWHTNRTKDSSVSSVSVGARKGWGSWFNSALGGGAGAGHAGDPESIV